MRISRHDLANLESAEISLNSAQKYPRQRLVAGDICLGLRCVELVSIQ